MDTRTHTEKSQDEKLNESIINISLIYTDTWTHGHTNKSEEENWDLQDFDSSLICVETWTHGHTQNVHWRTSAREHLLQWMSTPAKLRTIEHLRKRTSAQKNISPGKHLRRKTSAPRNLRTGKIEWVNHKYLSDFYGHMDTRTHIYTEVTKNWMIQS